jgi:hypothetical protein
MLSLLSVAIPLNSFVPLVLILTKSIKLYQKTYIVTTPNTIPIMIRNAAVNSIGFISGSIINCGSSSSTAFIAKLP